MRKDIRTHKRTDMAKLIIAFRDFEKAPKKLRSHKMQLNTFGVFALFCTYLIDFSIICECFQYSSNAVITVSYFARLIIYLDHQTFLWSLWICLVSCNHFPKTENSFSFYFSRRREDVLINISSNIRTLRYSVYDIYQHPHYTAWYQTLVWHACVRSFQIIWNRARYFCASYTYIKTTKNWQLCQFVTYFNI
jgi:hypothetical protein